MKNADRYRLDDILAEPALMHRIAARILDGAVFVYPTETIYGIGGRCDSEAVRKRIIAVKQRVPGTPMILLAARRSGFSTIPLVFPEAAGKLAEAFWPGKLTLVLPSQDGTTYTAIRVTDHPFITALASYFDIPLFSTSANLSSEPYDGDPERIRLLFEGRVDFIVDAGELPVSPPSTVVKVTIENKVEVVREGVVGKGLILSKLGVV